MWFKNIENWSQKQLRREFITYGIFYLMFALIIPCIIVGVKYDLIKSSSVRLTGVGLILVVVIAVFLLKGVKNILLKLPQEQHKEQCLKFTILMIYSLMLPIGGILLLNLIKTNVTLACDTLTKCLASFIFSIMIDYMSLKYLEVEFDFRQEAKHQLEVEKRKGALTK